MTGCVARSDRATTSSTRMAAEHRRLNGDEILDLLVGRTVSYVNEPGVAGPLSNYQQIYRANGVLFVRGDRGISHGRYRIEGDRLCLTIETMPEHCRYVLAAEDGTYWVAPAGDASRRLRISIER